MNQSVLSSVTTNEPNAIDRDGTFALAAKLVRGQLRSDLQLLYGALRRLDDLVDDHEPGARDRIEAVESWCRTGIATSPETLVFAELVTRCGMRTDPVAEFCLAMRHDLNRTQVETQDDLETYCRRVAGSVGVMIAQIMGKPSPEIERGMASLGTGVQMAHVLRDIDVDLACGRLFIPTEAIERFGSVAPGKREALLRDQITRADEFLDRAAFVYPLLPSANRAVAACGALYREILRQIERDGYGRVAGPPIVPRWRQRFAIARAFVTLR